MLLVAEDSDILDDLRHQQTTPIRWTQMPVIWYMSVWLIVRWQHGNDRVILGNSCTRRFAIGREFHTHMLKSSEQCFYKSSCRHQLLARIHLSNCAQCQ